MFYFVIVYNEMTELKYIYLFMTATEISSLKLDFKRKQFFNRFLL